MHLVGYLCEDYHDAWSLEHKVPYKFSLILRMSFPVPKYFNSRSAQVQIAFTFEPSNTERPCRFTRT